MRHLIIPHCKLIPHSNKGFLLNHMLIYVQIWMFRPNDLPMIELFCSNRHLVLKEEHYDEIDSINEITTP